MTCFYKKNRRMRCNRPIEDIIACVRFLSRIPIPEKWSYHKEPDFSRIGWAFPLAGVIILLPTLLVMALGIAIGLPEKIVVLLSIGVQLFTSGALHEDGLADIADGFGGGMSRERILEIMQDSHVGTFGATALIMVLLARFTLLTTLLKVSLPVCLVAMLAAQVVSRIIQLGFWRSLPSARPAGLASRFGVPSTHSITIALICSFPTFFLLYFSDIYIFSFMFSFILCISAALLFRSMCVKLIGGQTGDAVGAIQVIVELLFLVGCLAFRV